MVEHLVVVGLQPRRLLEHRQRLAVAPLLLQHQRLGDQRVDGQRIEVRGAARAAQGHGAVPVGGGGQEEHRADRRHVPVPVPGDVHHEGHHARLKRHEQRPQRVTPVGEGVAHGGYDEQGHGGREQAKPDRSELAEHVEPLAVGVLDDAPVFAKTLVSEDKGAGAGAAQPVGPGLLEALAPERRPAGVERDEPAGPLTAVGLVGARDEGLHAVLDPGRAAAALEEAPRATADAGHQHQQHRGSGGDPQPAWPRHGALHEHDHSLRSRGDEQRRQRPAQQGVALESAQSIVRGRAEERAEVAQTPQHSRHGPRDGHQARETGETRRGEAEVQDQRQDEHDQAAARQGEEEREAERHRGGLVVLVLTLILYFGFTTTRLASFASLVAIAGPVAAVLWRLRDLGTLFSATSDDALRTLQGHTLLRWSLAALLVAAGAQAVIVLVQRAVPWPRWLRVAAGAAVLLVLVAGIGGGSWRFLESRGGSTWVKDRVQRAVPWPRWLRVAAGAAVLLVLVAGIGGGSWRFLESRGGSTWVKDRVQT